MLLAATYNKLIKILLNAILFTCCILLVSASEKKMNLNEIYLKKLEQNMNLSADPCENFYEYACGNWAQNYAASEYLDMPGYMDYKVNKQFLHILETCRNETGNIYEKLSNYYEACVQLQAAALNPYLKLVQRELNFSWPLFRQDWQQAWLNETQFDWWRIVAALRVYGLNGVFLTQNVNVRLSNGSHYLIELHQHQPYQLELKAADVAVIFVNFGMTQEESANVTAKVVRLEAQMKNLTVQSSLQSRSSDDSAELEDKEDANKNYRESFKEMSMQEFVNDVPQLDWRKYFRILLAAVPVQIDNVLIQTFALNTLYFSQLQQILTQTSNETIAYYIMLKFMYYLNDDLPSAKNNSILCIKQLRGLMPLAMNSLYETHYYKQQRKHTDAALIEIYNKLRVRFEKLLREENNLQLNATEMAFLLQELQTMQMKIGNIPAQLTASLVERHYANVHFNVDNYYANHMQLLKFTTCQQQLKLLNQPIAAENKFYEHDAETASSSSPVKIFDNAILVPYGYLQLPLFHYELNALFQYSLLGFILSHEIMHAFDMFHIAYDHQGNYNEMGIAVAQHFWQYIECSAAHNTHNAFSENLADIAGIRLAYHTYFEDVLNNLHTDAELTTSGFSVEQLFFINSVQFLCADMSKISTMNVKASDLGHDMHDVRVLQNWANFEQFAWAFQCANATRMHPAVKCRLW